jgi:hypothetical protein
VTFDLTTADRVVAAVAARFNIRITTKGDEPLMRVAAKVLAVLHIAHADVFLADFATTIPLPGGVTCFLPTSYPTWSPQQRVRTIAGHEPVHAAQIHRDGAMAFIARYTVDHADRAAYEAEAMRSALTVGVALGLEPAPDGDAQRLVQSYGCTAADVDVAAMVLRAGAEQARDGIVVDEVARVVLAELRAAGIV